MEIDQDVLAQIRRILPSMIAEELCSVQPMNNIDWKALEQDPLANALASNFLQRQAKKD